MIITIDFLNNVIPLLLFFSVIPVLVAKLLNVYLLYLRSGMPISSPWTIYNWFVKTSYNFKVKANNDTETTLVKIINTLTITGLIFMGILLVVVSIFLYRQ